MRKFAMLAVAAFGTGAAAAADISHTYLEAGYALADLQAPGANVSANGFMVSGSFELPRNFTLFANFTDRSYGSALSNVDESELSAGVAYVWSFSETVDLLAGASYERLELKGPAADEATGFGLRVGMRALLTDQLELNSALRYADLELDTISSSVSGFVVSVGTRYHFTPALSAGLDVTADKIYLGYSRINALASLRYSFGDLF